MNRVAPRVLLVVADSVRPDFLGCYAPGRSTAGLDTFAAEGALFETVYAAAPWTVPSIGAMLTGRRAHRLGLVKWEQPFPDGVPTLFDRAAQAGIPVASFPFDPGHLFVRFPQAGVVGSSQDGDAMLRWFQEHDRGPLLAFVHHWSTHVPYLDRHLSLREWNMLCKGIIGLLGVPDPARRRAHQAQVRSLYQAAVERFCNAWLPSLVEAAKPDLLVITADHGESWGERLAPDDKPRDVFDLHGNHLHDEVMRVPLILHGPGLLPRTRVRGQASGVDLMPTLLDLMGLEEGASRVDGRSLAPFLESGVIADGSPAHFCRNRDFVDRPDLPTDKAQVFRELGCVQAGRKLLREVSTGRERAYDLVADPEERAPVAAEELGCGALAAALDQAWADSRVGAHEPEDYRRMRARLQALGYL